MKRRDSGYSLLESMLVVGMISIISTTAIIQLKSSLTAVDADIAANTVVHQIRYARQIAVDQRRNVIIAFDAPSTITVTRIDVMGDPMNPPETTVMATVTLPVGFTFDLPSLEDDTPDGYGNGEAVTFNGATVGTFLGDGTFVDDEGIVMSGSIFTIGPNGDGSARAITLAGASGRIKQYYINEAGWVDR